jgi:very-short-patch-repair endonuclease
VRVTCDARVGTIGVVGSQDRNSSDFRGPSLDGRVLRAARHGVVTGDTLRALGLDAHDILHRVRVGRLHRRYTGVFAVGRPDLPLDGRFLAAVLACGPRASLSWRSAARKYLFLNGGTTRIDVTAPRTIKPKPGIRLHRPLSLSDLDTTVVDGIPITITTVARTLLDCSSPALRVDVGRMMHEAGVKTQFDARDVWGVLARHPNHPGARRLDRALREEHPVTRSGLEDAMVALLRRRGLEGWRSNQHVWAGDELVEVDFVWLDERVIVEVDSHRYHGSRWRQRKDAEKTAKLQAAGWIVLRITDTDINGTPARVAARIAATLGPPKSQ